MGDRHGTRRKSIAYGRSDGQPAVPGAEPAEVSDLNAILSQRTDVVASGSDSIRHLGSRCL